MSSGLKFSLIDGSGRLLDIFQIADFNFRINVYVFKIIAAMIRYRGEVVDSVTVSLFIQINKFLVRKFTNNQMQNPKTNLIMRQAGPESGGSCDFPMQSLHFKTSNATSE